MANSEEDPELVAEGFNRRYLELSTEYRQTSNIEVLRNALDCVKQAVEQTSSATYEHNSTRAAHLTNLGRCQSLLYKATGSASHLDEAIKAARLAVKTVPEQHRLRPLCHVNLSDTLADRYFARGADRTVDFEEALQHARIAVATADEQSEYLPTAKSTLASRLGLYFEYVDSQDHFLNEAVRIGEELVATTPETDEMYGVYVINLAADLRSRFTRYTQSVDLQRAKEYYDRASKFFPPGHQHHILSVMSVANILLDIEDSTGKSVELEIILQRIGDIEERIQSDPERAKLYHLKSRLHSRRYEVLSNTNDLELAVQAARYALTLLPGESALRSRVSERFIETLRERAQVRMSIEDIDAAIDLASQGLAIATCTPAQHASSYNTIGNLLWTKFELFGGIQNLKESLDARRKALDLLPRGHRGRPTRMHNTAISLRDHYEYFGTQSYLDESIQLERNAAEDIPENDPDRCMVLDGLSISLSMRFKRSGNTQDLDEAIVASSSAVVNATSRQGSRPGYLNGLSNRLSSRFSISKDKGDIDQAIAAVHEALDSTTIGSSSEHIYLCTLSNCLSDRYEILGDIQDLNKSIEVLRDNITRIPESNPLKRDLLHNLGLRLQLKYHSSVSKDEKYLALEEAHSLAAQCVNQTPENHPDLPGFLTQLACRQLWLTSFMDAADEEKLLAQMRLAASTFEKGFQKTYATPSGRIMNGQLGGYIYIELKELQKASKMLSESVNLFRRVSPLSLDDHDRQRQLRGLSGISSLGCTAFISMGKAEEGVEILEAGRGIMASIAMGYHSDLQDVKEADSILHGQYLNLRDTLSQPLQMQGGSASYRDDLVARRNEDFAKLEIVESRIRNLPKLERFNLGPTTEEFKSLAIHGPLVAFCTVDRRCDAIIITSSSIDTLHLPTLKHSDIKAKLALVVGAERLSNAAPSKRGLANKKMRDLLAWIWDNAVQPVLNHLHLVGDRVSTSDQKTRLWWVTSGPMGLLPLHAAGKGQKCPSQNVFAHVNSSYIPTFSSLAFARQCQAKVDTASPAMALITMPETPGGLPALATEDESQAIREAFDTSRNINAHFNEFRQPSSAQVLHHVRSGDTDILHIACHAEPNLNDPSHTTLLLGTDPEAPAPDLLPIHELRLSHTLQLSGRRPPRLAYLSACCTAQQYDLRLIDENIHLASAFLLCGFPAVIGTLWEADDAAAVIIAKAFYEELFRLEQDCRKRNVKGQSEHHIARALDHATDIYRKRKVGRGDAASDVLAWASFVHIGA